MTLPSTMNAAVHDRYGDADAIYLDRRPVPAIADDEVLIQVEAAGLDRGTWHLLTGQPYAVRLATGLRQPREAVLGRDVAGRVVATGSAVHGLAIGDAVFGVAAGSFAEYAKAKERKLARRPDALSPVEAAVLGISGMTALQAVDAAQVKAESKLLIIGASGGVGSYAVQVAHGRGARVTGVSRAAKTDFVRSLGAERVIAYDRSDGNDFGGAYDAIIDPGGDTPLSRLRSMLAPRGTLVIVGGEGGGAVTGMGRQLHARILSPFVHQRLTFIVNREHQADLDRLADLANAGLIKAAVETVYPLDQAADAMRQLVGGQAKGKISIVVSNPASV
jgi:NADPH:quinone reductase-like Zn-dependent oxidoreductase